MTESPRRRPPSLFRPDFDNIEDRIFCVRPRCRAVIAHLMWNYEHGFVFVKPRNGRDTCVRFQADPADDAVVARCRQCKLVHLLNYNTGEVVDTDPPIGTAQ